MRFFLQYPKTVGYTPDEPTFQNRLMGYTASITELTYEQYGQ